MVAPTHVAAYLALLGLIFPVIGPDMPWHSSVVRAEPQEPTAWILPEFAGQGAPLYASLSNACNHGFVMFCSQSMIAVWEDGSFVYAWTRIPGLGFPLDINGTAWRDALNESRLLIDAGNAELTAGTLQGPKATALLDALVRQDPIFVVSERSESTTWISGNLATYTVEDAPPREPRFGAMDLMIITMAGGEQEPASERSTPRLDVLGAINAARSNPHSFTLSGGDLVGRPNIATVANLQA